MTTRRWTFATTMASMLATTGPIAVANAIEEPAFQVVAEFATFQVRRYQPFVIAEVVIDGAFEDAGSEAFDPLFQYISGDNQGATEMSMTAPVIQRGSGEKMAMTAPVLQSSAADAGRHRISFVLPAGYDMDTAPAPSDPQVRLRQVPARTVAVIRYSGFWSESNYREHERLLRTALTDKGYQEVGPPEWARYNAPFVPWFMRRNEVLIPVR